MYRHNGGYKGSKNAVGGMRSLTSPRGYANGGYFGETRRSTNLDENALKISGIWKLSGTQLVSNHEVITQVDNSYYCNPPSENQFCQTGETYLGGGYQWNIAYVRANCPGKEVQWPQGEYGPHSPGGYEYLSRTWTTIGVMENCESWVFDVYGVSGYYYTYYPPPVYVEQIDNVYNYYDVWDFFG